MTLYSITPATGCSDSLGKCSTATRTCAVGNRQTTCFRIRWSGFTGRWQKLQWSPCDTSSTWRQSKSGVNCSIWQSTTSGRKAAGRITTRTGNLPTMREARYIKTLRNQMISLGGVSFMLRSRNFQKTNKKLSILSITRD